jgi:two-component system, chemotaxis family, response regulator Rcp1
MHLLLVEDNRGDVALVREALKDVPGSLRLSVVRDGLQALAFLHRQEPYAQAAAPDLVFLDLNLPLRNGYAVLADVKHDPALKGIPVVVLTSTTDPQEIHKCYELGANAYIIKPLELAQYCTVVKAAVEFWSACQFRMLKD